VNSTHNTKTKRLKAALGVAVVSTGVPALLFVASGWFAAPAFAICNEGTPNCQRVDAGHQKAQDQINNAETSGQCAGPNGFCDDNIPGSDVTPATKPVTIHAPIPVTTKTVTTNTR
jgi:hypothetical protein